VEWMHLAQDMDEWQALLNMVMNLQVLYKAEDFLIQWVTISFSRMTLLHGVKTEKLSLCFFWLSTMPWRHIGEVEV
jgi:hypothetical protein